MKFSDVVIAAAAIVLFGMLLDTVLWVVFLPQGSSGELLAWILSFLIVSLIVGYVFAIQIQEESRIKAIGKITVLSSLTVLLLLMVWVSTPLVSSALADTFNELFNTSSWTNSYWSAALALNEAFSVLNALVFAFIGLFIGSMLRKPKKT